MIERANVEQMKSTELLRLARVLKLPILDRKIARDSLIEKIMEEINFRKKIDTPAAGLNTPAIKIESLIKRFGKKVAVWGINLQVNPGEIVGLVGPNGAGKTTTLRILTGIIKPTSGSVEVDGHDMLSKPILAKSAIGYIPEKPTCYPSLTVREYITFMARIYEVPSETALVRMRQFVDMFQLDGLLDSYVGTLSKGNLQRALLVGIFVREPPYVLALDEPIYGLDPRGAWNLKAYLKRLRDEGSAILISTHILEVAADLCDRFIIMNEAEVVGRGSLEELLASQENASNLEEVFLSLTGGIPE
ncbi:MAG: ATP-binding cassette domain-containing protein [Candidatus Thorarchaeota archaeon]|nr:MAG: ATP-binding cassette domain-containing protein [Candidatus Thorarchaeota archaeon]